MLTVKLALIKIQKYMFGNIVSPCKIVLKLRVCFGETIPRAFKIFKNISQNYNMYVHDWASNMV